MIYTNQTKIDELSEEHARIICSVYLGLHPESMHENEFIGAIVLKLKEWKFNLSIHELGEITITRINYPKELEIKAWNLKKAFIQAGIVLGKIKAESLTELLKVDKDAS